LISSGEKPFATFVALIINQCWSKQRHDAVAIATELQFESANHAATLHAIQSHSNILFSNLQEVLSELHNLRHVVESEKMERKTAQHHAQKAFDRLVHIKVQALNVVLECRERWQRQQLEQAWIRWSEWTDREQVCI
jgi:hypothetical protein